MWADWVDRKIHEAKRSIRHIMEGMPGYLIQVQATDDFAQIIDSHLSTDKAIHGSHEVEKNKLFNAKTRAAQLWRTTSKKVWSAMLHLQFYCIVRAQLQKGQKAMMDAGFKRTLHRSLNSETWWLDETTRQTSQDADSFFAQMVLVGESVTVSFLVSFL